VSGWRLHDLRRTCVSGMARLGIAPHVADKILMSERKRSSGGGCTWRTLWPLLLINCAAGLGEPCEAN
jgi:hypothetical protein